MISFVVPAYNEEAYLPATLDALFVSAERVAHPYEVIVVNDASADRTAEIGRERGARVIDVNHRQIAATRNSGARASRGEFLFFVDADTRANPAAVGAGLDAMLQGAVGGGCVFRYDGPIPWWAPTLLALGNAVGRAIKVLGGAFLFCRRAEFDAVGGFCERYYAAEELAFVNALKRRGRFVIPRPTVLTSNRKLNSISLSTIVSILYRAAVLGPESFTSREGLGIWYGPEARRG
jgi:glycosyltransferase involved in cell wall biosynthesis